MLYNEFMETKENVINDMVKKLQRIINTQLRIEELHVIYDEGIEVTPAEIHTIETIGKHEGISVTGVADSFGVTKSATSQLVSKLKKKGFVKVILSPRSNKEYELFLTEWGWRAFYAHEAMHGKHLADLVARIDAFTLEQISTTSMLLGIVENVVKERLSQLPRR